RGPARRARSDARRSVAGRVLMRRTLALAVLLLGAACSSQPTFRAMFIDDDVVHEPYTGKRFGAKGGPRSECYRQGDDIYAKVADEQSLVVHGVPRLHAIDMSVRPG